MLGSESYISVQLKSFSRNILDWPKAKDRYNFNHRKVKGKEITGQQRHQKSTVVRKRKSHVFVNNTLFNYFNPTCDLRGLSLTLQSRQYLILLKHWNKIMLLTLVFFMQQVLFSVQGYIVVFWWKLRNSGL